MIFICGTPRSGTSLTTAILDQHSSLYGGGELHFYDEFSETDFTDLERRTLSTIKLLDLYKNYSQFEDQEKVDTAREQLYRKVVLEENRADALNTFLNELASCNGKITWANSTPRDVFNADKILADLPNSKFIFCVRNPYDFVASYKNRYATTYQENTNRLRKIYHPISACMLWLFTLRKVLKISKNFPSNTFVLKYENLTMDPFDTLNELCSFLDINFEDRMLDVSSHNSSYANKKSKGIFCSSVGKGTEKLTLHERGIVDFVSHLYPSKNFGYSSRFKLSSLIRFSCSLPSSAFHLFRLAKYSSTNGRNESFFAYIIRRLAN